MSSEKELLNVDMWYCKTTNQLTAYCHKQINY